MSDRIGTAPAPEKRISVVYAWVAIHKDGGEGLMAHWMNMGDRVMPLVSMTNERRLADKMTPFVQQIVDQSQGSGNEVVRAELRTFDQRPRTVHALLPST